MSVRGAEQKFSVLEIRRIIFADDPRELAAARDNVTNGQFESAIEQLKKIVEKDRKKDWMEEVYIAAEADYARLYKPERRKKKL